ncbi:MAG: hypothetical protein K8R86_06055 [Bacteroidales bacterium]|nr:hypothetical protein [Bacteroidales bacterium]
MKNIINITIWFIVIAGIFVLVGFINVEQKKITCKSLNVTIDYAGGDQMLSVDEIKSQIYVVYDSLIGKRLTEINLVEVEDMINDIPLVANAEVYTSLTGKMKIHITQRSPILRIINSSNQSFYIDQTGVAMPVTPGSPSRVMVASGNIKIKYSDTLNINNSAENSLLKNLYTLSSYIDNDPFLNAQVEQIYVTKTQEFELVPKVGRHLIIFGGIEDMENKFDKLMVFYHQGMNKTGWDKYKTINLKFENQVVCSK